MVTQACEWISNHITLVILRSAFVNDCCNRWGLWDWIFAKPYYRWWLKKFENSYSHFGENTFNHWHLLLKPTHCVTCWDHYLRPMILPNIVIYVELYSHKSKCVDGMKGKVRIESATTSQISSPQQQTFASLNSHQQSMWQRPR